MNLTPAQILMLVIATLGVLTASATQLTDLFGPNVTKGIIAGSSLSMSILSGWAAILFGQGSQIAAVQAMPGVDKIIVNEKANATLATMAVDNSQSKIQPTAAAQNAVQATARAAS